MQAKILLFVFLLLVGTVLVQGEDARCEEESAPEGCRADVEPVRGWTFDNKKRECRSAAYCPDADRSENFFGDEDACKSTCR